MIATTTQIEAAVRSAVGTVDDPEYPGISIIGLGLLESVCVVDGVATIGLIPTFSGCPALRVIADDVAEAVRSVAGVIEVNVRWLASPVWSIHRVSAGARERMANEYTVAVQVGSLAPACPRCAAPTVEQSMFGPSRCRSVHRCTGCGETIEVMRR